jgi:chorismate mutase
MELLLESGQRGSATGGSCRQPAATSYRPPAYFMDIADWRKKIDEIDQRLVAILNERAQAAQEIGRLKRRSDLPIYEPDRERIVLTQVQEQNRGPLQHRHLIQIYERIMDVMRNIQKDEIVKEKSGKA